ncbi:OmpL47-type beta-barrel domain-containing protein [Clostridium sp. HV4-5-A1G]|uniref:OmpL47-type beta-barrel domain-containing protein n=1 Tax=Clostridium sp. HV4-5-A1G TaxID=2004595 RepID=UPI00123C4FD7|nr:hypothetical protein [Clostridium sp. HV4-5-A1G]KAA8674432.1 hypothetical protein F3O63_07885 [Clostridium sp. HV4-5-A1G]
MNLKELNFLNPKTRRKIAAGAISVAMGFSIVAPNIATVANVAGIQITTVKAFADTSNVKWIDGNGLPGTTYTDVDTDATNDANSRSNKLWHWINMSSWVQEQYQGDSSKYVVRGHSSARCSSVCYFYGILGDLSSTSVGWRPVLEVLNTDPLIAGHNDGDIVKFGTLYVNGIKQKRPLNPVYGGDIPEYSSGSIEIRDTDSDDAYKIQWVLATDPETGKKLLIADRNILSFVSWDKLNGQNLVSGKDITIDSSSFKIRLLTGGSDYKDSSNPYAGASNLNNEWDQIINRGDGTEPSYQIDKIYNSDDQSKYGSWFTGFYAKSLYDNNDLMRFILHSTFGTATLSNGGVIQDESQIRDKYFLSDGSMILIDIYGMVQYYKDLTTSEPATLPIDGSGIIGADTLVFGTGTSAVKHPVLYFGSSSKYIDTDGSLKTFTLKKSDVTKMFAYKYAKGASQYMLIEKADGSLVYLDSSGHQQDFGLNMNDVSYIMPATNVNKDIFVMKDGTLRDDKGVIATSDGVTLSKIWSNRIFEMSDGFLYTLQNGTFKNTNTLASFARLAQNNALLLKNGNFQLADATGNLTNDLDVAGADVKYMSQLDSTNMYLILNDGTTYGVGDKVQGDSLENHGININDVSAFLSNGSDNVVRALVTKDGTVYTNPGSWAKNTLVHFSSDAVNSVHGSTPVYTNPGDVVDDYNNSGDPDLVNKLPGGTDEKGDGITPPASTDTTTPTLNVTGNPTDWTNEDVTLSVSASDEEGGSGLNKIVLPDNSEITAAIGTFKVIKNGTYTFKAYDKAGNITTRDITVSKIDKTAPGVPAVTNNNGTVTITAGTDADSGVKEVDYSVDGGAYQKYTIPFTLEAGSHTVKAKTVDNAGNESSETSKDITVGDSDAGLQNATQAVENAESTKSQGDVDTARDLVDVLPDSQEKQDLEDRLDKVQDEIDKAKEDAQKLHDATDAVDHAGDTKSQEDLDHAKDLVDSLPDGPDKDKLEDDIKDIQDEIDQINQEAQDLADATAAVEKAERTKTKSDYDTAVSKVSALKDGADKTGLSERLDNVKAAVDTLIADADSKVTQAESSKTESDINAAQSAIDKVPAGWDVSGLQDRLDSIRQEVEGQELAVAKAAVEKAEISQLQEDVNGARVLVNKLPYSQDRTDLNRRLDAVQNIINLYENAEQRVQAAEKLKTESAVSSARSVVSKLPDGDRKDSLNARLDVVEAEIVIDNTIKAIDRDITALEKDVDSHIKYNSNMDIDSYKNKVTALRDRVNALPDSVSGTKLAFNERLDTVDSKLTKQKGVQDAVSKVVDAIDKAGQTLDNKDIQDAQDAIDNLPDGVDRSKYQSELDIIKQKRQAKVAKDTTDANKAVTKASRTRLQTDIDAARTLVNALPDGNNKAQLSKQLDLIQKYVKK